MFDRLAEWGRRIGYLVNRRKVDAALEREMEVHRAMLDRPARFGNTLRLREDSRDAWGWRWLDDLARDLRLSVRTLRGSPTFTLTMLLILSLGIGLNTAFFQVLNVSLVRPLNLKEPDSLVRFDHRGPQFLSSGVPYPVASFVASHNTVLSAVLLRHRTEVVWSDAGNKRVPANFVSAAWLHELGARTVIGRLFDASVEAPDAPAVVVISHGFWQRQLGGRRDIVGATVRVNERPALVIGVVAADFPDVDLRGTSLWVPLAQLAYFVPGTRLTTDSTDAVEMFARLAPGVSAESAADSLNTLMAGLHAQEPNRVEKGATLVPRSSRERFLSDREAQQIWVVASAVSVLAVLVLLVACLNLSNLTLARVTSRLREMSIRVSLGAGRWRIVRHLLTESLALSIGGAVGGLALAQVVLRALPTTTGAIAASGLVPDWRTGVVMAGTTLLAMLAVGLVPAWRVGRTDLAVATRDGGERASHGLHGARLRYALVAGQVAGSCVLLVFTAQLTRSLQRALAADLGFDFANVAVFEPSLNAHGFRGDAAQGYWDEFRRALDKQPGAAASALVSQAPLSSSGSGSRYRETAPSLRIVNLEVEPAFFSTMRIPLLAGRLFGPQDDPRTTVIISRRAALVMYGTTDVVGRYFPKNTMQRVIVGIAGDAHLMNVRAADAAEQYWPLGADRSGATLLVRALTDPARLLEPMRRAARAVDPQIRPAIRLLREDFEDSLRMPRIASSIAGAVDIMALGLACLGIFGVVSYAARLRTKEIGIRMALGSRRSAIIAMLSRSVVWAGGAGLVVGLGGGFGLTRALTGAPFYLQPNDPAAYVMAALGFSLVGAAAAILPALRTLRDDPLKALRQE